MKYFSSLMMCLVGFGGLGVAQAQLGAGSMSSDTSFALFDDGASLAPGSLSQFEGKIVLAFYYTPW